MEDLDFDPEKRREQLIRETEDAKRQAEQEKQELLQAVENEEEFEHRTYEWVELGDVEMKVKAWFGGDGIDVIKRFGQAEQEGQIPEFRDLIEVAKTQTEVVRTADISWSTDAKINEFWDMYYQEHGSNTLYVALERVFTPALENMEGRVPDSFQSKNESRPGFRPGVQNNRE